MKRIKKVTAFLMVVLFQVIIVITAYGSEVKGTDSIDSNGDSLEVRYISTCPGGDKHNMYGKGFGQIWLNGELKLQTGTASQCRNCNLVLVTENNPFAYTTRAWGMFATESLDDPIYNMYQLNASSISYNSSILDDYAQGFIFEKASRVPY